jgi:hypothetical protein
MQACPTCPASTGGAQIGQPTVQPTLKPAAPAENGQPATPQPGNGNATGVSNGAPRLQPLKELDKSYRPSLEPELFDTRADKTTSLNRASGELRHVSLLPLSRPEPRPSRKLDDSGWRAAR